MSLVLREINNNNNNVSVHGNEAKQHLGLIPSRLLFSRVTGRTPLHGGVRCQFT